MKVCALCVVLFGCVFVRGDVFYSLPRGLLKITKHDAVKRNAP